MALASATRCGWRNDKIPLLYDGTSMCVSASVLLSCNDISFLLMLLKHVDLDSPTCITAITCLLTGLFNCCVQSYYDRDNVKLALRETVTRALDTYDEYDTVWWIRCFQEALFTMTTPDVDIVTFCLDEGLQYDLKFNDKLLATSCKRGWTSVVRVLLDRGVVPVITDYQLPLTLAIESNVLELVSLLLSRGVDVDAGNSSNHRALHRAVELSARDLINTLLAHGCDPNPCTDGGITPLYIACRNGSVDIARQLMDHLDVTDVINQVTNTGWTSLFVACFFDHDDVAQMLIDEGADPNIPTNTLTTPLHASAANGNIKLIAYLIEHGARPLSRNLDGKTPEDIISVKGGKVLMS